MSKFHSYIESAKKIINTYSAGKPLALHLKNFFAADKKFGSRDRKMIGSLCYSYFRTGKAFGNYVFEERLFNGLFLCENKSNELLRFFRPGLDNKIELSPPEKILLLEINWGDIFPYAAELGNDINADLFALSFLIQPATYLRIRPGRRTRVLDKLSGASVNFELLDDSCLKLEKNIAADKILSLNKDAVVQDMNSQKILNYLDKAPALSSHLNKISSWDCCAASGGKSILLYDKLKENVQLTVSDIRENILLNLQKRLSQAGININRSFVTDLSQKQALSPEEKFSIIICDVPCTGSGTWSRNPEQLCSFEKEMIDAYAERQRKIVSNTIPHLQKAGLFFYITCSVFRKENEEVAAYIEEKFHLQLMQMEYLKGYETVADTMFVAVFKLN